MRKKIEVKVNENLINTYQNIYLTKSNDGENGKPFSWNALE